MSNSQPTDQLIERLSDQLEPAQPLRGPLFYLFSYILIVVAYSFFVLSILGFREDLAAQFGNISFLFETLIMSFTGLSAAFCAFCLRSPDMYGQKGMLAVPLTFLSVFALWMVLRGLTENAPPMVLEWHHCINDSLLMSFIPALAVFFWGSRGKTTHPFLSMFMSIIAVGAWGYVGMRFTCPDNTVLHNLLYHVVPYTAVGALLGIAAQRIYRW